MNNVLERFKDYTETLRMANIMLSEGAEVPLIVTEMANHGVELFHTLPKERTSYSISITGEFITELNKFKSLIGA